MRVNGVKCRTYQKFVNLWPHPFIFLNTSNDWIASTMNQLFLLNYLEIMCPRVQESIKELCDAHTHRSWELPKTNWKPSVTGQSWSYRMESARAVYSPSRQTEQPRGTNYTTWIYNRLLTKLPVNLFQPNIF